MRITKYESDDGMYEFILSDPVTNRWKICKFTNFRLRYNENKFDLEPLPSNRSEKWIREHSFEFNEGMHLFRKLEKNNKVPEHEKTEGYRCI